MNYQVKSTIFGEQIIRFNDNGSLSHIPKKEENSDYQAYLAWLAEGNTPLPADEGEQT
jgi:hypothetical protein